MSMVEAVTNVVVGYALAIATQIVVFPWFGIETGLAEHLTIGLAFVGFAAAWEHAATRCQGPAQCRVKASDPQAETAQQEL